MSEFKPTGEGADAQFSVDRSVCEMNALARTLQNENIYNIHLYILVLEGVFCFVFIEQI